MRDILGGLKILEKYTPEDLGDFAAEHDQIWAGIDADDMDISEEDLEKLDELGWFLDEEFDSWSHFC